MRKRILSMFMACVLSFSMMPVTAFAEETDVVTEQEVLNEESIAEDDTTGTAGADISGGDVVNEDAVKEDTVSGNTVIATQALNDALPVAMTAENGSHTNHPVCGDVNCTDSSHALPDNMTWQGVSNLSDTMSAGYYYLTADVTLTESWAPANGIVLCLNGHSITMNADKGVITVADGSKIFTLCDCNGSGEGNGKITHGINGDTKYSDRGVYVAWATFNMYGGTITGNSITKGDGGGVHVYGGGTTFNMYGGIITDNSTAEGYNGGGVYVDNYAVFTMHDGTISSNHSNNDGGGVYVYSGSVTMNGGSIRDNSTGQSSFGGGVFLYQGSFTMVDGSIIDNTSRKGGGVYVDGSGNGTFTMTGGEITGNTATSPNIQIGGGVYVGKGGTVTVSGAVNIENNFDCNKKANNVYLDDSNTRIEITGALDEDARIGVNTYSVAIVNNPVTIAKGDGYALTDADAACFISDAGCFPFLVDGEVQLFKTPPQKHPICGKTCTHGGIHPDLIWEGITELADATKAGNYYLMESVIRPEKTGPWWCRADVNLCLNGHSITAAHDSYAIMVTGNANFTLTDCEEGGSITHSSGNTGYGVVVDNGCSFTMYGGTICGNTAANSGSGVIVNGGSSFIMNGGTITGNNTTGDVSCGGVYVMNDGSFTVSGASKIQDNWKNGTLQNGVYVQGTGTASNVYLTGDATINIGAGLAGDARIGVSKRLPLTVADNISIATRATEGLDYKKIFQLDGVNDPNYSVICDNDGNLFIHRHEHSWTYQLSEDGTTVTAVCNDTVTCPYKGNGGSVTIKAPKESVLTYDGKGKAATLEGSFITGVEASITYRKGNYIFTVGELPTDAGAYTADIMLGDETMETAASVTYTIKKASLTADNFIFSSPDNLIYDGSAKIATLKTVEDLTGIGTVTVKYYQGETEVEQPVNAGSYTVEVSVSEGTNFNAVSDLTCDTWQFTIASDNTAPSVELTGDMIYTGEQIRPDVTVSVGSTRLIGGRDYDVSYGENKNAGTGTVTITAKGNYGFTEVIKTFNIEKADPKLHFEKSAVTITWGDAFPGNMLNKPDDITVNYTSSNEEVAKYNGDDLIICGAGTITITAGTDETTNYKAGTASYTLTVNKAGICIADVDVNNKDYDGSVAAEIKNVSFVLKNGNRLDELALGQGCTATGTFSAPDVGCWQVRARVELTGDYAKNYELESNIFTTEAYITAKSVRIAGATAIDRSYERNNTSVKITELEFCDAAGNSVTLAEGTDYAVTGEMDDADSGNDKNVNVGVTLTGKAAHNYNLADGTTITKVNIYKVSGGTLPAYNLQQKFSDHAAKIFMPEYELPGGEAWRYSISSPKISGDAEIGTYTIEPATGEISYNLKSGEADTTISWTVTISNPNYEDFHAAFVITIIRETPTGEPGYTVITAAGRTLADVGLTLTGSSLNPQDGVLEWIDDADNVLPDNTEVEVNKSYKWRFSPVNKNYTILTGEITPYPVYSITDGVNSSWTQNTDGTLAIRGNGEFTKFRSVKVDGSIVAAANYTVTEGSTIITLKAEYLKTLAVGSHTFEIVWTDGSAGTNFTVAANTPSNNGSSNNDSSDSSSNDSTNNTDIAAPTNDPAQEMDKVPATGDPFGIWLTLFVISLTGFAGMLARRKKN